MERRKLTAILATVLISCGELDLISQHGPHIVHFNVVAGRSNGPAFKLFIGGNVTDCIDVISRDPDLSAQLAKLPYRDRMTTGSESLELLAVLADLEVIPETVRYGIDGPVVSSDASILFSGSQVFLECQDYTSGTYAVYEAIEVKEIE